MANSSAGYVFNTGASGTTDDLHTAAQFAFVSAPGLCLTTQLLTSTPTLVVGACLPPSDPGYFNQLLFTALNPPGACGGGDQCSSLRLFTNPLKCVGKFSPTSALMPVQVLDRPITRGPGWFFDYKAVPGSAFSNEYGEWMAARF